MKNLKPSQLLRSLSVVLALSLGLVIPGPGLAQEETAETQRIVYPPAPETPVIEWRAMLKGSSDVQGTKKKRLQKILLGGVEEELTLDSPTLLDVAPDGTIAVVDQNQDYVLIINESEQRFEAFTGNGSATLAEPIGVAFDGTGRLFVSDGGSKAVYGYGEELLHELTFGGKDRFARPVGLAITSDGSRLAVSDSKKHQVMVFDTTSAEVLYILGEEGVSGRDGDFRSPTAVAYDDEGFLYVCDYLNFRIQIFDPDGELASQFGQAGDRPGDLARPRGIAVDTDNQVIYITDGAFGLVQMFNFDGEILMWFGNGSGSDPGFFLMPTGIARHGNSLIVADTLNHRLQRFEFLGVPPTD